ncbi:hypothetical protein V6N13_060242 [Hibiscus sabdariffa]
MPTEDMTESDFVQPVHPQLHESSTYGPWMIVERRQRRGPKKQTDVPAKNLISPSVGSRFNILADNVIEEQTDKGDDSTTPKDVS